MIKFDTMKLTYKIPENKSDITVTQFIKLSRLYKQAEDDEVEVNEKDVVSICLDIPVTYVSKFPLTEYNYALEKINEALNGDSKFYQRFKYKGIEFGFIPDLENITAGEFAALDEFLKDSEKHCLDIINVLYRPITEEKEYSNWWSNKKVNKYNISSYNDGDDVDVSFFKDVPYDIYEGAIVFFYSLGNDLLNATQKYINQEGQKMTEVEHSEKNGDGFKHLIHTLKRQIHQLNKLEKNLQVQYSYDWHTKAIKQN